MKRRGRPVLGAFSGFFAGLFGALTLLAFGVVQLDSILVTLLPVLLGVIVWAVAMWFPLGGRG
jgi:H+/Cl- antiporter ClcA